MIQNFVFNGARIVNAQASFFKLESCNAQGADESVRVRADGQDLGLYLPGDSIRLPSAKVQWEITPVKATAVGMVRLGMGDVGSSRITGTVRVEDEGVERTLRGEQYIIYQRSGGVPGKHRLVGVTAGSRIVVIKKCAFNSAVDGVGVVFSGTAAPTDGYGPGMPNVRNKRIGGALAQAVRFFAEAAGATPTTVEVPGFDGMFSIPFKAGVQYEMPLTTPIVLAPGMCFGVSSPAPNQEMTIVLDIEERMV